MKVTPKELFKAFSAKNYRVYFAGQGISLIGTWMQRTTMGWFVYRLTDSPFLLGLILFFSQIPSVFIGPFSGVWADRWNRLTILKITQFASFLQATTLAVLVITNHIQIWHIVILSLMSGAIEAVDAPARQSFVIELVEKKSLLTNAIALNSAMFNGARLIGPAVAGIIIGFSNEGFCFLINGISYIAVIISLFLIRVPKRASASHEFSMVQNIREGWNYAFSHLPIKFLLANITVLTMFGMSYAVLMPIFAKDILKGTAETMGFLMSMAGLGALTGAMYLASRTSIKGLSRILAFTMTGLSLALILFSLSKTFIFSLFMMLLIGIGMSFQMATSNTILQSVVDDNMRGRIMSLHSMAFMSTAPFGSLLAGYLTKKFDAPVTLSFCALICLIWALYGFIVQKRFICSVDVMMKKHIPEPAASQEMPDFSMAINK
jgi:MFS family permease